MRLETRIKAFTALGNFLKEHIAQFSEENNEKSISTAQHEKLAQAIEISLQHNGWFTKENIYFSLNEWSQALTKEKLENWTSAYNFSATKKTVAIIMAGNIPLVGFHDFLSVLLSGNKALVKMSSNDKFLLPALAEMLIAYNKDFENLIAFEKEQLKNFDAVIATGSNNTARYFDYYFRKKPAIIRKNRNAAAILTGKETTEQLKALAEDIFRYYGLGCRNVAKLFIPKNYDFSVFFEAIYGWHPIINHHKYANNYDYNKAVYLMSNIKLLDNNFLVLKEDTSYSSPIACLFYEYYNNEEELSVKLKNDEEKLQCIVSSLPEHVDFGESQHPALTDYADGVDTLQFLSNLNYEKA